MSIERKTIKGKIWLQEDVGGKGRDQNTGGKIVRGVGKNIIMSFNIIFKTQISIILNIHYIKFWKGGGGLMKNYSIIIYPIVFL